jgi:hypothetical protein
MFAFIKKINSIVIGIDQRFRAIQEALGRIESRQNRSTDQTDLTAQEYKVYSQGGEDGLIQFLLNHVEVKKEVFVEFGVENYLESNTRFLLVNNNWSGLVIDGSAEHVEYIKSDPIYWRHNLKADCAFITKDNINELLKRNGVVGDIGLLSIDMDGNDYWVWKEIEVISPRIVIVEYNSRFGPDRAVTIPYDANFERQSAHYSMIYFGASLAALVNLGRRKGYAFVGCNQNGVNAFFVRKDVLNELKTHTASDGYVSGKFRDSRDNDGKLAFMSFDQETRLLNTLPLIETED